MKKTSIILLLMISLSAFSQHYETSVRSDGNKNFTIYDIKRDGKEFAKLCLIDSSRNYNFYSLEKDSVYFKNIESNIYKMCEKKKLGKPACAIMAKPKRSGISFNFHYFFESLGIILYAPPFLKGSDIIGKNNGERRFFFSTEVKGKSIYYLIEFSDSTDIKTAYAFVRKIKGFERVNIKLIPIKNFPLKLISYENGQAITIYESHANTNYSCMFLTNKDR